MKTILSLILLAAIPVACVDRTRSLEEMSLRQFTDRSQTAAEESEKSVEAIAAINTKMQTTAEAVASNLKDMKQHSNRSGSPAIEAERLEKSGVYK